MKHHTLRIVLPLIALSFGLVTASTFSIQKETIEANASSFTYWDSWISSHSSELEAGGPTLVSALKEKITQAPDGSANTVSYNGLWAAFQKTDSVPGTNGNKIIDYYGGCDYSSGDHSGNYSQVGDMFNREHSVPKSWFSERKPAYSDLIHLMPTDGKVNGTRSNYAFGEVANASETYELVERTTNGVTWQEHGYSKFGTPKSINGVQPNVSKVFEPSDQYKGDFARIYMYFAVRYGGGTCQATSGDGSVHFTSSCTTSNPYVTDYSLALFQKWHVQDPVSSRELERMDAVETLQGNRNPFVDHPEWADKIFHTSYGSSLAEGSISLDKSSLSFTIGDSAQNLVATSSDGSSIAWDVTPSGVVSLSSAVTNSGSAVTVTPLSEGEATIKASSTIDGKTYTATCAVSVKAKSTEGEVSNDPLTLSTLKDGMQVVWGTSSDNLVKSIENNWARIGGTKEDCLVFTVEGDGSGFRLANNGSYVYSSAAKNIALSSTDSTSFALNQDGSVNGGTIGTYYYNPGNGIRPYVSSISNGEMTYLYRFDTSSAAPTLSSLVLDTTNVKKSFVQGDLFDVSGLIAKASYSDGSEKTVTPTSISTPDMNSMGEKEVVVTYVEDGKTVSATYTINVTAASYRPVLLEEEKALKVDYSSGSEIITPIGSLTVKKEGYTAIENNSLRLASSNTNGSLIITSPNKVTSMKIRAKSYGSDTSVSLTASGGSDVALTTEYGDYEVKFASPMTEIRIETEKGKRANIECITLISVQETDIGHSEDCLGLEAFIRNFMHMDYQDNLGYCADSEHGYYVKAKEAFNGLNDHQRSLFAEHSAYASEYARLMAWANANGDVLTTGNLLSANRFSASGRSQGNGASWLITLSVAMLAFAILGGYFLCRKEN